MSKSNKKIVVLMLILSLLMGIIAGCGTSADKDAATEVITVKFSYPPYGYDSKLEDPFWKKYIAAFEKENPNIKIEMTVESWNNLYTKWNQYFESGDTPDIGYNDGARAVQYGVNGKIQPINDVIKDLGGEAVFTPIAGSFKQGDTWYAVPNCAASPVLAYRKDLLKAAGFNEPPKNWDELVSMSKALTKDGVYGLGMFTSDSGLTRQIMMGFMKAAGGKVIDEKGNVVINSPENLSAVKFMSDLVTVHKVVPPSAKDWKYGDDVNALGVGKIAMDIMWGGYGTLLAEMFPDVYQNIGFVKMPDGPSGHSGSFSGAGGFFLFKNAKHPEEAKKFIKYMCRPEISKEWCQISGNVSPFLSIAKDTELMQMEWYKAVSDQSFTAVALDFESGYIPGTEILYEENRYAKLVVDVMLGKMTAEESLKKFHQDAVAAIENAKKH
ncbi:ABC transporter substrate-binding protein [Syntrophomonas wolfei]|uniref:ABC-type sugar transport system periplasmic component-like protein n=1 Tax=Syntrophomonas wolfei subsp. wolfei (strain DSM 2245B / Goettingen) TaxID=335541 RepID=Q0AZW1_SYNWW|nr:sugar ABC transporter substrate-binding protein [Syntrophomonas wolfei]ABI67743.1 ABC-type sugar transport system periplasmic component-like protein [Syntrophomonas wolfei subsp. wolfei str. Goettingen G311]